MMKRSANRLMLLLLCLLGWHASIAATVNGPIHEKGTTSSFIDQTDDSPQLQDVKMCDFLAVTGGSTLTPPTTVRVVHDSPSGITPAAQSAAARHYSIHRLSAYCHCRMVCGYIYMIHCLRL